LEKSVALYRFQAGTPEFGNSPLGGAGNAATSPASTGAGGDQSIQDKSVLPSDGFHFKSQLDSSRQTAAPAGRQAIGPDVPLPPPATLTQYAADQLYNKIKAQIPKGPRIEIYPELSKEEQLAGDIAAGVAKYAEWAKWGTTAIKMMEHMPDGQMKDYLKSKLGAELDKIAGFLDGVTGKLGKVGKYADIVKDAIGITKSAKAFAADVRNMDFKDPESVEKAIESLGKVNERAQGILSGARDYLLAQGSKVGASAGLVLSYGAFMVTAGIELGRAGVKAERAYIDKVKAHIELIEHGGVDPRRFARLPDEPAPIVTYEQLRRQEFAFDQMLVAQTVKQQFRGPRAEVDRQFEAQRKAVHGKFHNDVVPNIYQQNRGRIMGEIRRTVDKLETDQDVRARVPGPPTRSLDESNRRAFGEIASLKSVLRVMGKHKPGSALSQKQSQEELTALRANASTSLIQESLDRAFSKELTNFYEKNGVGEDGIDRWYEKAGVSDQVYNNMREKALREAGL
jgi:hypothetical protein